MTTDMQHSDVLTRLALDLSWSWSHSADEIWKRLDPEVWDLTANPWMILQALRRENSTVSPTPRFTNASNNFCLS